MELTNDQIEQRIRDAHIYARDAKAFRRGAQRARRNGFGWEALTLTLKAVDLDSQCSALLRHIPATVL